MLILKQQSYGNISETPQTNIHGEMKVCLVPTMEEFQAATLLIRRVINMV